MTTKLTTKIIKDDSELTKFLKGELAKAVFVSDQTRATIDSITDTRALHMQSENTRRLCEDLLRDAIVFLKSQDERETFHDKMTLGLEKLSVFLKEYSNFEQILYGAWEDYRDHIAHSLRVMLLGDLLIRGTFGFEKVATPLQDKLLISGDEKEAMWIIIALTHDLGLPLEAIQRISDFVRRMLYAFGMASVGELTSGYFAQFAQLSDFVIRFVSSSVVDKNDKEQAKDDDKEGDRKKEFTLHVQAKYYQKFLSALSGFNHGVVSCIILMQSLVFFKESEFMLDGFKPLDEDDARQFLIRNQILRAIASHSCKEIYHLGVTNFPFILTLCDEMQEWGRPRLVDVTKRAASQTMLIINKFEHNRVDYAIRFSFPEGQKPLEEEVKTVSDEVEKYFNSKSDKWLNVLRSAVSPNRDIELVFTVENETDTSNVRRYTLHHTNPEKVQIDRPK